MKVSCHWKMKCPTHFYLLFCFTLYLFIIIIFKKSMKWQLLWECFQTLLYDKLSKFCPWNVTTVMCHIFDFTWKLMCMFQNIFAYNSYKSHFWLFLFILQQRKNQNRKNLFNFNKYLPRSCIQSQKYGSCLNRNVYQMRNEKLV